MSYPFKTTFYDLLYTNISSELMAQFPKKQFETNIVWYKRLLYEYISYLQAKYESSSSNTVINTNTKPNQKKTNPNTTNFTPSNKTLFETNLEKALDVVSMDANFAVYLFIQWFAVLLNPGDWIKLTIKIDQTNTPASNIPFTEITIEFTLTQLSIISINGISFHAMKESYFNQVKLDPFLKAIFKMISFYARATIVYDYDNINELSRVHLSLTDLVTNAFKIGEILWKIKEITRPLFINEITIQSNLITSSNNKLTVQKGNAEKTQRLKFNSRKFISSNVVTDAEKTSAIIQSLMIAIFRTYYDYDPNTISQALFNYMFYNTDLSLAI